jgi:hypothetical protein
MPYTMVDEVTGNEFEFDDKFPMEQAQAKIMSMRQAAAAGPSLELPWYKKAGKAIADVAPAGGMMIGGALAAPVAGASTATIAGAPAAPFIELGGVAGGGAVGEMIKRQMYGAMGMGEKQTFGSQVEAGLEGGKDAAMAGMLPGVAIAGANKVIAPYASDISIGTKMLVDRARELDLPIPAQAFVGKLGTSGLQWLGESLLPGKLLGQHYRGKLSERLASLRSEVIGEATGTLPYFKGVSAAEGAAAVKPSLKEGVKEAYAEARDLLPGGAIKIAETRKTLGALSQNPKVMGNSKLSKWLEGWLEKTKGGMKSEDFPLLYSQVNTMTKKLPGGGDSIFEALSADLKAWDATEGVAIAKAFAEAKGKAKNSFGFDATFKVFQKATKRTDAGEEIFMPSVARAELARQRDQIQRAYGGDAVKMIEDYLSLTEAAARGTTKLQIPGNPFDLALGGGAAYGGSIATIAVPYGTSFAVVKSLTSSKGLLKRWLLNTRQISAPPSLKRGVAAGIMYGMEDDPSYGGALPLR